MTTEEKAFCESWVKAHAHKWQVLNRAQWKYQFRGKAMVRYVDEVQMRENEVRLLLEYLSSDDCIATLSVYDQELGAEWKPIKAWLEVGGKAAGAVRSIRLYHGLRTDVLDGEDGPYVVEDGCAYKVSLTYHWNEATVPQVQTSTSGVSYRITGISRDPDTGLYTYAVETRERVQQDIAEYLMSQTVYAKASEEVHLGVRQDDVASTGQQVSVGDGKLVERKLSKNADCTSDIHNKITEELPVSDAVVEVSKTLEGIIRRTKNKSQPEPAPLTPEKPGSSVTNEKTPGGLYDQTIVEADETPLGVKGEGCGKTIFEHSHSTTENIPDRPTIDAPRAADGVVEKQSASMTRYGTWDVHKTVETELPVAEASKSVHVGLTGTVQTVSNRNQDAPEPSENLDVGESVENTKTPGGLWNTVVRNLVHGALTWLGETCHKTIYEHRHGKTTVQSDNPGFTHVEEAGGGKTVHKSVSRTSDGAYKVDEDETQENPVAKSSRTVRMTLNGEYVREESRNQPEPLPERGLKIGESVTNSKTPGGLYNTSHDIPSARGAGKISERCHQDKFTHQHTQTENKDADADDVAEHSFEDGVIVDKAVSLQSNGTKDVTTSTTTPKPWIQRYDWWSGDTHHYVVKYGNQQNEFASVFVPTDADSVQKSDHVNAFNLHDGSVTWSYGPWHSKAGDLKFIKHGKSQKFYMSYVKPHDRKRYHRVKTIQTVFIRGDAYTDFISSYAEADANRTQEGVLAVKLLEKYRDKDGNLLAEWVELRGSLGAENVCTSQCAHGLIDEDATKDAIDLIIKNFEASSMTKTSKDTTAEALRGLECAMIARDSRRDYISENTGNDISGGVYAFRKSQGWSDGLGFEKAVAK